MQPTVKRNLVVASNRLPVVATQGEDGSYVLTPGSGGLVSALLPGLRDYGCVWVGWPGIAGSLEPIVPLLEAFGDSAGYHIAPVALSEDDRRDFYCGFANEIVWPLFHDRQSLCNFDPQYWRVYQRVNRDYAEAIRQHSGDDDLVWVHDYHLINVAAELRELGSHGRIAFFAHIPFPCRDIFINLPWRQQLLRAFLEYDVVGFQTERDRRNFLDCVRHLIGDARLDKDSEQMVTVSVAGHSTRVGSFPISIDFKANANRAASPVVAEKAAELRAVLPNRQLILGVDRLDYTKGIPQRLLGFRHALTVHPELRERVTLIQIVVPSREDIPQYGDLKLQIERLVGEINGIFTRPGGWVPIHYVFRHLSQDDLVAYYRAAQIALVTPLKDGMNLVAKEYCACSLEEDCALILSEFAGAAEEFRHHALLVNPYDIDAVADAIYRAVYMRPDERSARMRNLRRLVRRRNVFRWVNSFLQAAAWPEGCAAAASSVVLREAATRIDVSPFGHIQ